MKDKPSENLEEKQIEDLSKRLENITIPKANIELMGLFADLLNEGFAPEVITKELNLPKFRISNWINQGKLGNPEYKSFYDAYSKAISNNCEICGKSIPKPNKICGNCSKKAHASSILKLLLKHIHPLIQFRKEDFKKIGYSDHIDSYITLLNKNNLLNKIDNDTFSLKNYSILNSFIKKYDGHAKELTPQVDSDGEPIHLSKKCDNCNLVYSISDFSKSDEEPFEYSNICKYCERATIAGFLDDEKLINSFLRLLDEGYDFNDAVDEMNIPNETIELWINKGKENFFPYDNVYREYRNINAKKCEICNQPFRSNSEKTICKSCLRKRHTSKNLIELLEFISPEIPFRKEDLEKAGFNKIKINDCIWSLQENDLIDENKGEYSLKSKDVLDDFISEYGISNPKEPVTKPDEGQHLILNKTCKICGETLPIRKFYHNENSPDGYEDFCKNCKRSVNAARSLKWLLENVNTGNTYCKDELMEFYSNDFDFQSNIWSMQDYDLIKDEGDDKYSIASEEKCRDFLDKNYIEKEDDKKIHSSNSDENNTISDESNKPIRLNKKEQMEIVLDALRNGKTKQEAAKLADIPVYKIIHWKNEGKQRMGKDNIYFYKQLKDIELNRNTTETTEKNNEKNNNKSVASNNLDNVSTNKEIEFNNTQVKKEDLIINYINTDSGSIDVIIKGIIKNNELLNFLNKLKEFEKNIIRIITTAKGSNLVDIFIELNLSNSMVKIFKDTINTPDAKDNKIINEIGIKENINEYDNVEMALEFINHI